MDARRYYPFPPLFVWVRMRSNASHEGALDDAIEGRFSRRRLRCVRGAGGSTLAKSDRSSHTCGMDTAAVFVVFCPVVLLSVFMCYFSVVLLVCNLLGIYCCGVTPKYTKACLLRGHAEVLALSIGNHIKGDHDRLRRSYASTVLESNILFVLQMRHMSVFSLDRQRCAQHGVSWNFPPSSRASKVT